MGAISIWLLYLHLKLWDYMRSSMKYVARADLLGVSVFGNQAEEEEQSKDTKGAAREREG